MRIAILPGSCAPFDGLTLLERPLGGTETAVIRLAEALSEIGHKVFVLSQKKDPRVTRPLYLPHRAIPDLGEVDVLIGVRELLTLFTDIKCKARYFWTGDSYDQLQHLGLGDRRTIARIHSLLAVSHWQADRLCAVSGYPRQQTYILRNGFASHLFTEPEVRIPHRLIYTSTPYRGLVHLIPIFQELRERIPECELHVFSSMKVYEGAGTQVEEIERAYAPMLQKLKAIPGVTVHGSILQAELARQLMKSRIMVYPNTFEETSCIAAIEAMAAGCPIVTSRRGALPETIGNGGVFVDGDPASATYQRQFISTVENLLRDQRAIDELATTCRERAHACTWNAIARSLTEKITTDLLTLDPTQLAHSAR